MKKESKFVNWLKGSASDIWLFAILLVLINLVAVRAFVRLDLTAPRSYSLSKASKEVVKTIEEPLSVKVFFSKNLPAPYAGVEQYVKDILVEYAGAANKNFSYEYFNMDKPENQSIAQTYGLQQVQIREVKNNEVGFKNAFMGLVITYADQIEKLDNITTSDGFEYNLTTTISKVIASTNALSGLAGKVQMTLYLTDALSNFGISGFNKIDSSVQKAYENANKKYQGKIEYQKINPSSEDALALAQKYGIQNVSWKNSDGTTSNGVIGLVLEYGEKSRVVPLQMQNMIFSYVIAGLDNLEENIASSVESLVSRTTAVAYVTGHGEASVEDAEQGAGNFAGLLSDVYSLEEVNLAEKDIPVGVQTVIVNGPKSPLSEEELYKLDQFVLRGGSLMLFLDSYQEIAPQGQNQYYQQPQYLPVNTGMEKLLEKYGLYVKKGYVMDENCFTRNDRQYGKLNFYYVPIMPRSALNQKNPVTKNLSMVLFYQPSAIDVEKAKENKDAKLTVLAKSSPDSWILSNNIMLSPLFNQPPEDKSTMKQENLAVLVEGKFQSAFDSNPAEKTEETSMSGSSHITSSTQSGKVFVAGSSQITSPMVISEGSTEPVALFVRNAVDYMNGNEDFCAMRTKAQSLYILNKTSGAGVNFAKIFNQAGLAVLVALAGLFVYLARRRHREQIRLHYNANDQREMKKGSKE